MKRLLSLSLLLSFGCAAQTGYVANAIGSNYSAFNVLAPEMLATITEYSFSFYLIPTSAEVFIVPSGSTTAISVPTWNLRPGSVMFLVPAGVPAGTAELYWRLGGEPFRFIDVTVAGSNFELASVRNLAAPARPGQTFSFDGSGLGYGNQVSASVGGQPATVVYAGRGNPAGHDQIQVQIPASVATGCYVPVVLSYGQYSVTSSLSITPDGAPCSHPFQLSVRDLKNLDAGGSVAVTQISLASTFDATTGSAVHRDESAVLSTDEYLAADLADSLAPALSPAGCSIGPAQPKAFGIVNEPVLTSPPQLGANLVLRGPAGGNYYGNLPSAVDGTLTNPPAPALAAGKWAFLTPGSTDLAPSEFDFTLPTPFQINGGVPVSLSRTTDQVVTWNGAGLSSGTTVSLSLTGRASSDGVTAIQVLCNGPANAGSITMASTLLANFASKSIGSLDVAISSTGLIPQHAVFQTKAGTTLVMFVSYSTDDRRPVDFQ